MKEPRFKILDICPLVARGEEPFSIIRARVDALQAGEGLTVTAPFLPAPLIELLKSEGFCATPEWRAQGGWAVHFWRDS